MRDTASSLVRYPTQLGASLLEVLVAIVIVAVGLLGLAGLQARMQLADLEAYQRTQAIMLLEDMASRIQAYANNKQTTQPYYSLGGSSVMVGTPGTGVTTTPDDCTTLASRPKKDRCEWANSLKGAAEVRGSDRLGAMIGARGCLEMSGVVGGGNSSHTTITVVWQGTTPTQAPSVTCGQNLYNANCPTGDDRCRRAVTMEIRTFNPLTL